MNIFDFFNSPDVAAHCRSIGHALNSVESAVMINQSDSRTLAEKHAAYRAIIAEYPDMEIPEGNNHHHINSFHKSLEDIIIYVSLHTQGKLCLCGLLKIQKYLMFDQKSDEVKRSNNLEYDLNQIGDNLLR